MKEFRYSLETFILYLEKKLSIKQNNKISEYLYKTPEVLEYITKLSKIIAINQINTNKISVNSSEELFNQIIYEGDVSLISQEKLQFRNSKIRLYHKIKFSLLEVFILRKKELEINLLISNPQNLEYDLYNSEDKLIIPFLKHNYLMKTGNYNLKVLSNNDNLHILEINII